LLKYRDLRELLHNKGASERVAKAIFEYLNT